MWHLLKSHHNIKKASGVQNKENNHIQFMHLKFNVKEVKMVLKVANKDQQKDVLIMTMLLFLVLLIILKYRNQLKNIILKKKQMFSKTGNQLRKRNKKNNQRKN